MPMDGIKTYTELSAIDSFIDRYRYLRLGGHVGEDTFGFDRYLNQIFYRSPEWKSVRDCVILRDNGCDLGIVGHEIFGKILIHHMNPVARRDILDRSDFLLNPEYLICVSHATHNAIHYGNEDLLPEILLPRRKNDTCPWK